MADIRSDILRRCLTRHDDAPVTFAGGEQANNKLDLEKITGSVKLRARVAVRMAELVRQSEFYPKLDMIVAVPNGANWLALDMGYLLGRFVLQLDKDPETKDFSFRHNGDNQLAGTKNIIIVDDVLNQLTNTSKVYELPDMAERTNAVFGIWDRNPDRTTSCTLPVPVQAIISEYIPAQLPSDSKLWKYTT